MALDPDKSLLVGMAGAGAVWAIHNNLTPSLADVRVADKDDTDVEAAEKTATLMGTALAVALGLLSRDATVFVITETVVVAMAWTYKHANQVDPRTGSALPPSIPADTPESAGVEISADENVVEYSY
ncbi:MAG: hypothetical protein A2Y78_10145 [Acidobacteria bacterium RBG_13_68_16]|nr:MAG: hypothetical protein A2Y78_10145 [Acidobacteria bacterium RBG_13_68_16]